MAIEPSLGARARAFDLCSERARVLALGDHGAQSELRVQVTFTPLP